MSDHDPKDAESDLDDEDRAAILARRNRFVRAALTGIAGASILAACSGDTTDTQPCLSPPPNDSGRSDGTPQPCLGAQIQDSRPPLAADAASDADDANDGSSKDADAEPQPCLSPPIDPDAG